MTRIRFKQLPVGCVFKFKGIWLKKTAQGSLAGFAKAIGIAIRMRNTTQVYVEMDLRLAVAIARGTALADRGANDVHAS